MATTATQLMTAEEFFDWANRPENAGKHYELERGRVVEVSRPGERHAIVCLNVGYVLASYIRQRRKGYAGSNDAGILWERDPDTVRGPGLFFYDENRRYKDYNPRYSDQPPTLVVEVISPNDKMNRVVKRVTQFLKWGVKLVWVIDPEERTIAVYETGRTPEVFDADQELTGGMVLPDFRCRVDALFYTAEEESAGPDRPPPARH
jgi:Uma2 family endonuclease